MSIENCPLTQIPTEIVSGGPSLVIQVNDHLMNKTKYFRLRLSDEVSTERPETDLRLT